MPLPYRGKVVDYTTTSNEALPAIVTKVNEDGSVNLSLTVTATSSSPVAFNVNETTETAGTAAAAEKWSELLLP